MKQVFLILFLSLRLFAEVNLSPNMSLPIPVPGTTPGPDWANDINSCLSAIDSHNHTPGYGVQIPPDGLNINAALPMNNYPLSSAQGVIFQDQSVLSTLKEIYTKSGDLFFNDGSGNNIRITQNGSVAGASGTITGLPSGTASASYQSVSGTFQFQSATNTPANISGASFLIQEQAVTPNGITIKSPLSLGASYSLTLPTALPAATSFVMESTSGALSNRSILAPTTQRFLSGSGTYTTSSGVLYIKVTMIGAGGGGASGGGSGTNGSAGGDTTFGSATTGGGGGAVRNASGGGGGSVSSTTGITSVLLSYSGSAGASVGSVRAGGSGGGPGGGLGGSPAGGGGGPGADNSGGGGGGAGDSGASSGAGGGAGAYLQGIITSPSATYSYSIGAAGAAGTGSVNGAAGGSGVVIVEEYYQ